MRKNPGVASLKGTFIGFSNRWVFEIKCFTSFSWFQTSYANTDLYILVGNSSWCNYLIQYWMPLCCWVALHQVGFWVSPGIHSWRGRKREQHSSEVGNIWSYLMFLPILFWNHHDVEWTCVLEAASGKEKFLYCSNSLSVLKERG